MQTRASVSRKRRSEDKAMGYTTDFKGRFNLNRPLSEEQAKYLKAFNETRRMKRADYDAANLPDPTREAVCLSLGGEDAPYFTGGRGDFGQDQDKSIRNYNRPPDGQPGLWCQWTPTADRAGIEWDGGEKFYDYTEWLQYLMDHFLTPWGFTVSGEVTYQGEDADDSGTLTVRDGKAVKMPDGEDDDADAWEDVGEDARQWVRKCLLVAQAATDDEEQQEAVDAALGALGLADAA